MNVKILTINYLCSSNDNIFKKHLPCYPCQNKHLTNQQQQQKRSQLTWAKDATDDQPRTSDARKTLSKHKLKHSEISLESSKAKPDCMHYAKI